MRFEIAQWLTKSANKSNSVPMVIMFGTILKEKEKAYFVELHGKPEPTTHCLHCGRVLKNKVSMFYGLGPVCGKHYYIVNVTEATLDAKFDEIRKHMANITYRGWLPKNSVKITPEIFYNILFVYNGQEYKVRTSDETKVNQVKERATKIISIEIQEG